MTVDIQKHLDEFRCVGRVEPISRFTSFDYCYNYFQDARKQGTTGALADGDRLMESCLQLGFYFASWGMMRGSGKLITRSLSGLVPVVRAIAAEPPSTWDLSAGSLVDYADEVHGLGRRLRPEFGFSASDTMVTKVMLGVFGCVPAFDTNFCRGFRVDQGASASLRVKGLKAVGKYYAEHRTEIDAQEVLTLDFSTERETSRRYPAAKIIDIVFFQEGAK
jgi:hypothetical protein